MTMRKYINLFEQADADNMYRSATKKQKRIGRQDGQEYTDRGRADTYNRTTNARYGDNAMTDFDPDMGVEVQINEFEDNISFSANPTQLDQLHQMLTRIGMTDDAIRKGIKLSNEGKQKVSRKFGISPDDVELLMDTLAAKLNKENSQNMDALIDDYYSTIGEDRRPFDGGTILEYSDRFSTEPDALGNVMVRDRITGNQKLVRGSQATEIMAKLKNGADKDALLAPLFGVSLDEAADVEDSGDYMAEIEASAGTYNFPWEYHGEHGFATVFYRTDLDTPHLKLNSVRDADGNEIEDISTDMRESILDQARSFIGNE